MHFAGWKVDNLWFIVAIMTWMVMVKDRKITSDGGLVQSLTLFVVARLTLPVPDSPFIAAQLPLASLAQHHHASIRAYTVSALHHLDSCKEMHQCDSASHCVCTTGNLQHRCATNQP